MATDIICAHCHETTKSQDACSGCARPPLLRQRFALLEMLGHGAAGHTWRSRDVTDDSIIAIKELSFRRLTELKQLELFEREAATLRSLDHPGIPTYEQDFVVEEDRHVSFYLVQEFIDGDPLRFDQRIDEAEVIRLLSEMAEILSYLQSRRPPVIHRDIKPSNIMRRIDGSYVLIDFGSTLAAAGATVGGSTVAGTLGYMAPEQLQGHALPASDIYGLGATAIAMLAGRDANDLLDIRYPGKWREKVEVNATLGVLLERMVEVDETRRLAGADQLQKGLRDLGQRKPASPEPVVKERKAGGSARRELQKFKKSSPPISYAASLRKPDTEETWRDVVIKISRDPVGQAGWLYMMVVVTYMLFVAGALLVHNLPESVRAFFPAWSWHYVWFAAVANIVAYAGLVVVGTRLDPVPDEEWRAVRRVLRWRRLRWLATRTIRAPGAGRLVFFGLFGPVIALLVGALLGPLLGVSVAVVAMTFIGFLLFDQAQATIRHRNGWERALYREFDEAWTRDRELRKEFRRIANMLWGAAGGEKTQNAVRALKALRDSGLTPRQREHVDLVRLVARARFGNKPDIEESLELVDEMEPRRATLDALHAAVAEAHDEELATVFARRYVEQSSRVK